MKKLLLSITLFFSILLPALAAHPGGTAYVDVNGLVCDFCARAIEKVFNKEEAVDSINVDMNKKVITIHFKKGQSLDNKKITQLIQDSGYNVQKIRYDT